MDRTFVYTYIVFKNQILPHWSTAYIRILFVSVCIVVVGFYILFTYCQVIVCCAHSIHSISFSKFGLFLNDRKTKMNGKNKLIRVHSSDFFWIFLLFFFFVISISLLSRDQLWLINSGIDWIGWWEKLIWITGTSYRSMCWRLEGFGWHNSVWRRKRLVSHEYLLEIIAFAGPLNRIPRTCFMGIDINVIIAYDFSVLFL